MGQPQYPSASPAPAIEHPSQPPLSRNVRGKIPVDREFLFALLRLEVAARSFFRGDDPQASIAAMKTCLDALTADLARAVVEKITSGEWNLDELAEDGAPS